MGEMDEYAADYAKNTAANTGKMLRKYKKNIGKGLDKMQSAENKEHWQRQVSSAEAKRNRDTKVDNLEVSDLVAPMEETGINAYTKKTGSKVTKDKWIRNAKPYVEVAQEISANKAPVTDIESGLANVRALMEGMKKKKEELSS